MKSAKKWGMFFLLLILLGAGTALLFWNTVGECLSVLRTGQGSEEYVLAAADGAGSYYALGWRGDRLQLVRAGRGGEREALWNLTAPGLLPKKIYPAALYPASGGAVYLGLYNLDQQPAELQLYRLTQEGRAAELLLSEPCEGAGLQEQMRSTRLSAFSEVDSVVTFAVIGNGTAQFYQRVSAAAGLEKLQRVARTGLRTGLALSDGTLLLAGDTGLARVGRGMLSTGAQITGLTQAGFGVYYVDGNSLEVFYSDLTEWRPATFLSLEKDAYDMGQCTDFAVTRDGGVLLLMEGKQLLLDRGSIVSDLSAALYRPKGQCALILAAIVLGVLIATLALWYVLYDQKKFRLPLLMRWGGLAAAATLLLVGALLRGAVQPAAIAAADREAFGLMENSTAMALRKAPPDDPDLSATLGQGLAGIESGMYWDAAVSVYEQDADEQWKLVQSNTYLPAGCRAELSPSFDREYLMQALETGSVRWSRTQEGSDRWVLYRTWGKQVLSVDVDGTRLLAWSIDNYRWMSWCVGAMALLLLTVLLTALGQLTSGIRKVTDGMVRIAAGDRSIKLRLESGDELASLADDLNALSHTLEELEQEQRELAQSYRRFVPEQILSLLGKTSIHEVDKQTFASRELTAMMLQFQLPPEVYEDGGRELFDTINEILERTAPIVAAQGGAVFNFTYDGYDAVFEKGSAAGVSAAVAIQQEILEMNKEREIENRSPVLVRIALDTGTVMVGVVGDEKQISPVSISSSFTTVKHLMSLCGRLQAGILCTEAVIAGAAGYGTRYMGKCAGDGVRVYEIFDGDPYDIRKVKETTGDRFSEGVYILYSRDFVEAKRIFLSLVHYNTGDGGARYYLYLADQMEKQPQAEISLDHF